MTNLRKCLSVSAFAFFALAFCCLIIGQSVTASQKLQTVTGNSIERPVPLPSETSRGGPAGTALSSGRQVQVVNEDERMADEHPKLLMPPRGIVTGPFSKQGGDDISTAVALTGPLPISTTGTTDDPSIDYDYDATCGSYDGAPDVVYSYVADGGGDPTQQLVLTTVLGGTDYDTKIWILESDGVTEVACNDDDPADASYRSTIPYVALNDGETYYIVIGGYSDTDAGAYELAIEEFVDPLICDPSDVPEIETCGPQLNDGPVLDAGTYDPSHYEAIAANTTVCGTLWAEGGNRDNDYFHYEVTAAQGEILTVTALSDFADFGYFIMIMNEQASGYLDYAIGDAGEEVELANYWLGPGVYTIRIASNTAAADRYGYDCGTNPLDMINGNYRYKLSLDVRVPHDLDDCELAQEVTGGADGVPVAVPFDMTGMTGGQSGPGFPGANIWFSYTNTINGIVTVELCFDDVYPASWDGVGMAYHAACGTYSGPFAWNGFGPIDCPTDGPIVLSFPYLVGSDPRVEVGTFYNDPPFTGTITFTIQELVPTNDYCVNAEDLGTGEVLDHFVHNFTATNDGFYEPNFGNAVLDTRCDDFGAGSAGFGNDVWYTWTADATGWWTASTCEGVGWDGKMEIFEGTDCLIYDQRLPIACGDDDCGRDGSGIMPAPEFYATAGQSYLIRLGSWEYLPDYPADAGTAVLNITYSATPFPRPANDDCVNAPNDVVEDGVVISRSGTLDYCSNHDCLLSEPMVWEAFTLIDCRDMAIDYCGTYGTADINNDNYWVAPEVIVTDCPCYDGLLLVSPARDWDLCTQEFYLKTLYWYDLTPGTYYHPVLPGFRACPDPENFTGCDYGLNIYGTTLECAYCDAGGSALSCPASGSTWIQRVRFADIDRGIGTGSVPAECSGYSDFTTTDVTTVYQGKTYELRVTGTKNSVSPLDDNDVVWAYIDWAQDYSFYQIGDYFQLTRIGRDYVGNITIPYGVPATGDGPSGTTVMRLRISKVSEGASSFCGETTWGEVEDYALNVDVVPCGDFDGNDLVNAVDIDAIKSLYFVSTSTPPTLWEMADATGDCVFNIADIIYLADFVYGRVTTLQCFPCTPL